jgi:formamidopyrimidine-DNA glycosylase
MPELPEITVISRQMEKEIAGKRIAEVEVKQPKNLNLPVSKFVITVKGKTVENVSSKGKWIFVKLKPDYHLLLNLGMGAELLYCPIGQALPGKYHFRAAFSDGTGFTASFWWFGYIHLVRGDDLSKHKMTSRLGISPIDGGFTEERLKGLLAGRKTGIKNFLIDQRNIAGIGNVYVQDILFRAKLHPDRKTSTLSAKEIGELHCAILRTLSRSIKLGGLAYERDFYGRNGKFSSEEFLVGYKEGKPCPICKIAIEKVRTGNTSTYICPKCQTI